MTSPLLKKILLPLIVVVVLGGFGWVVTQQGPMAATRITVATVTNQAISASVFGIGTVEARYNYRIGPPLRGASSKCWSMSVTACKRGKPWQSWMRLTSIPAFKPLV
ncbi:hypothetical protein [Thiothrix subterranea]|uniref:hypothetical protein n=1 Tax=Thiothrix subterranea TaxID=2735563 RepID=UPI00280A6100|nr:hypothetical protein [Thiothrix subterranea]